MRDLIYPNPKRDKCDSLWRTKRLAELQVKFLKTCNEFGMYKKPVFVNIRIRKFNEGYGVICDESSAYRKWCTGKSLQTKIRSE